jgi:antitoxin ParD1/3/4
MTFLAILDDGGETVNVSLTPELERLINDKVETGSYQTASEVVREALRLLKHRDEGLVQLRGDIQAGLDQAARGEYTAHDRPSLSKLAARVKARGRKRLAALKISKRSTGR